MTPSRWCVAASGAVCGSHRNFLFPFVTVTLRPKLWVRTVLRLPSALRRSTRARNLLIVDFGTAITIDQVSADGVFRGGNISPGVQMRFRALHDYTAALPLCESCEDQTLLGRSTVEAIRQGVMNGIAFEIEGYIARLFPEIDALSIIFTGGDAKFFVKRIKNTIFAHCDLVFLGLNRILEYNASEESRR